MTSSSKLKVEIIAISFSLVLATGVAIFSACFYCKVCVRVRSLRYKWQVRYRDVSVRGVHSALDQCDDDLDEVNEVSDTKALTFTNKSVVNDEK